MRITDYELFAVRPRWLFTRLETEDGLVGWGEHVNVGEGSVREAVRSLLDGYLVGEDPTDIEDHWQVMYRGGFYRGGPVLMSAIAGIDQALWDLKGKQFGAPVHELLGGKARDRVRVYTWIGGDRPSDVGAHARERVENGYTAVKMNATEELRRLDTPGEIETARRRVAEVREAVGDEVDVALDFHGRVAGPMAKRLAAAVDPHEPLWIEEPVLAEQNDALGTIAAHTTTPIATGERMYSRYEFKDVLEAGHVDVLQPDVSHAGGITEVHKIAAMADAYDVALAPHCPLGPVAFAACLQVDACSPNALVQEQSLGIHYNRDVDLYDYLADPGPLEQADGYVAVPEGPGLGIDLETERFRALPDEPGERSVWRHEDGSVAEW